MTKDERLTLLFVCISILAPHSRPRPPSPVPPPVSGTRVECLRHCSRRHRPQQNRRTLILLLLLHFLLLLLLLVLVPALIHDIFMMILMMIVSQLFQVGTRLIQGPLKRFIRRSIQLDGKIVTTQLILHLRDGRGAGRGVMSHQGRVRESLQNTFRDGTVRKDHHLRHDIHHRDLFLDL